MALIILEGLDRAGKSSVADLYANKGFEIIHMSAPAKNISSDQYMGEMVDLLSSLAGKDVVLDRSHYGELLWPQVYSRPALLNEEDIEILREIEDSLDVSRILMHDANFEAHWQRCVDNKEPLTKIQFIKARNLYYGLADKYGFVKKTIKDFPDIKQSGILSSESEDVNNPNEEAETHKTPQQIKLEKANIINEVLSKRIIKSKGSEYDQLEKSIRSFLNNELNKLFGATNQHSVEPFSKDEVQLLKFFCERLKQKET